MVKGRKKKGGVGETDGEREKEERGVGGDRW